MTDATARPTSKARINVVPVLIVAGCAVVGFAVRYLAWRATLPDAALDTFLADLCRWDCAWYIRIAEEGYDPYPVPSMTPAGNWAFFPAYPLLVGMLHQLVGGATIVVATGASVVLSAATALVARPLLGDSRRAFTLFAAFLLCGPFSIYFTTFYTEVLFVFLTVCGFTALKRGDILAAGAFGATLSATRIVGVFFVLAILVDAFQRHRAKGGRLSTFIPAVLAQPPLVLAIAIAPLGLFAYMAFLHLHIGDALAFAHVQRAWGRPSGDPLTFLFEAATKWPASGWLPTVPQQLALATVAGFALIAVMAARRQFAAAIYSALCLIVPLFGGMASMLRFTVGQAPVTITAITILARSRWSFVLALAAFVAGGYVVTIGWLTGYLTIV